MYAVAIDGPAGAGKSTISRAIAKQMGFLYVDTGALYRAVALNMLREGLSVSDAPAVCARLPMIQVSLGYEGGEQQVYLNGENVSSQIRTPEISAAASTVSAIGEVRQFLFDQQQKIARENNIIMDGRDIGTVVLPHAQVKIYLTASPKERARRRLEDLAQKGIEAVFADVLAEIIRRDSNDMNRSVAPLKQAADAVLVDTTDLTFEQVTNTLLQIIRDKMDQGESR